MSVRPLKLAKANRLCDLRDWARRRTYDYGALGSRELAQLVATFIDGMSVMGRSKLLGQCGDECV